MCNHATEKATKRSHVASFILTGDRETTETPLLLQCLSLTDGGVAVDDNGIEDEAVLVTLDLADHVGLGVGRAVVVNHTKTALESHVDGHLVLGDSVHGGRDEGRLKRNTLSDGGVERHLGGSEANVAREQQEVIVGQTAVLGRVHELVEVEAILGLVLVEHLQGGRVVEDLSRGHFGERKRGEVEDE